VLPDILDYFRNTRFSLGSSSSDGKTHYRVFLPYLLLMNKLFAAIQDDFSLL